MLIKYTYVFNSLVSIKNRILQVLKIKQTSETILHHGSYILKLKLICRSMLPNTVYINESLKCIFENQNRNFNTKNKRFLWN